MKAPRESGALLLSNLYSVKDAACSATSNPNDDDDKVCTTRPIRLDERRQDSAKRDTS